MKKIDRRKNPRTDICNPISYFCMDKDGHILDQHSGVAFNVSQSGIGFETGLKIESDYILINFIDIEDKVVEIKGKVVYCRKNDSGRYNIGINFQGTGAEKTQIKDKLIRSCNYQKNRFNLAISLPA
jgi:c-di-GMP-binding flagellar brake protein YcgR